MQVGGVSAADVTLEVMLAAVPDLDSLLTRLRAVPDRPLGSGTAAGLPAASIRFESVGYTYPGGDRPVVDGLDLELTAGRSLALVGLNGAGKTTLVALLRLRDPSAGRITVDGTDLRDLDARSWQRQVAVVYQDFTRYPLTARENVAFYDLGASPGNSGGTDPGASRDPGRCPGAGAGPPRRAGTPSAPPATGAASTCPAVHEGGWGGGWGIALARARDAVARGARVLVLDEPTAQLDVRAEAAFYDRFLQLTSGVTTMVISHRFSTVRRADASPCSTAGGSRNSDPTAGW